MVLTDTQRCKSQMRNTATTSKVTDASQEGKNFSSSQTMERSDIHTSPSVRGKAAHYHAILDQLSDQLDERTAELESQAEIAQLRKKIERLRVHVRLFRRSQSGSQFDLEAGIEITLDDISKSIAEMKQPPRHPSSRMI